MDRMEENPGMVTGEAVEGMGAGPVAKNSKSPTQEVYAALEKAFAAMNRDIFEGALPRVLITFRASKRSGGYVWPGRFEDEQGNGVMELALNPADKEGGAETVLVRLGHQMLRVWQQSFGVKKPSRPNYHNSEFAGKAKEVGLEVSVPDGREGQITGDKVELAVVVGGAFEKAMRKLLRSGWGLAWTEIVEASAPEKRSGQRLKLVCPRCEDNVMTSTAEPECGKCRRESGEIYAMVEESQFLAEGAPWVLSDEERKELRAKRRGSGEGSPGGLVMEEGENVS